LLSRRPRRAKVVVGALMGIVALGVLADNPLYILGANPLMLEFAAGVGLARLAETRKLPARRWGPPLISLGLAAIAGPAIFGGFSEILRPLLWGAPAALIVLGSLCLEAEEGAALSPPLLALGEASYALYLVHLPATALVAHGLGVANPWIFVPAALTTSVAAGLACHVWVERPLLAWMRGGGRDARLGRPKAAA
jgi:exopolysaccharide production protein ExoZ